MALRPFIADLHIHTVLSPCGDIEMIPPLIIEMAERARLDMICIADHNSCENVGAVMEAAKGSSIAVLPGMEVQTVEGVHILCIFDSLDGAYEFQEEVYDALPKIPAKKDMYKLQLVVNSEGEFVRYCEHLIGFPCSLDLSTVYDRVEALKGITIPSHIDRKETGICGVLGMMPESPVFNAVEVSSALSEEQARRVLLGVGDKNIIRNSDAHCLSCVGERSTVFYIERRITSEVKLALKSEMGRKIGNA
ncbi:MAG: PHP domain-containing protein [Armatimonadota bacterium]